MDSLTFNFLVVGQVRSGTSTLASALTGLPGTHVHLNLFHPDEAVRRSEASAYFGEEAMTASEPGESHLFEPDRTNPYRYLRHRVFDKPRGSEERIGVRADYAFTERWQLHEAIAEWWRAGDFCLLHVDRNPVACYVSLVQARENSLWGRPASSPGLTAIPPSVRIRPDELTAFVRAHVAEQRRLLAACPDQIVVPYTDLVLNLAEVIRITGAYLEAAVPANTPRPAWKRLTNRSINMRIRNLTELRLEVPSDVRAFLDADDLY